MPPSQPEKGKGETKYLCIGMRTHTQVYRNHSVQCSRPPAATEWSQREKWKIYWGQNKFCSRPQGSGYHGNSDCIQGYFTWSTYQWRSFILGEFNDPQKTASKLKKLYCVDYCIGFPHPSQCDLLTRDTAGLMTLTQIVWKLSRECRAKEKRSYFLGLWLLQSCPSLLREFSIPIHWKWQKSQPKLY